MPQLNPNPWFFILALSWLVFSLIIQPKISSFTSTNQPTNMTRTTTKTSPWPWPWT